MANPQTFIWLLTSPSLGIADMERNHVATGCSPTFEEIALTDSLTAWTAAVEGAWAWWAGALRRQATPADLMLDGVRWWSEMTTRRAPGWSTPHEVVFDAPVARLRDFSTAGPRTKLVPTLVLPPQAGHDSC